MSALALSSTDLSEFEGEVCVMDVRLGERLGMAQPLDIRRSIKRNFDELAGYGPIRTRCELVETGSRARREVTVYFLNEEQALLLAMLSRSPLAQALRREIITVFMAWRRGKLATTTDADHRWAMLEKRLDQLERLITSQAMVETPEFTKAAAYAPPVFRLIRGDGKLRGQRYSRYWLDHEVRALMISLHRQLTLSDAVAAIAEEVGPERTPSKSALQRIWKQLDKARSAA
ncbi:hypothetical protein AAG602_08075 [Citromicrobium bathyomarinum]|nr:hypothetical protein [Citromicrobium sp. JL2201]